MGRSPADSIFTLADMEAAQQRMIHARVRLLLVTDMSGNVLAWLPGATCSARNRSASRWTMASRATR
ncbi:hypothetical protein [Thiomonas sp.]